MAPAIAWHYTIYIFDIIIQETLYRAEQPRFLGKDTDTAVL